MPRNSPKLLISAARIRRRVADLGRRIARDYAGRDLLLVGVLQGAFIFLADLARAIDRPVTLEFLRVRSYRGTRSSGPPRVDLPLTGSIRGRHVLVVEDIVDTGFTAAAVLSRLRALHPASLELCALLHKPSRTRTVVPIKYVGFSVPDRFIVGYGLDHDGRHRNLPDLRWVATTSSGRS